MASKSNRQRKLERARAERRLARQAQHARRKRQVQAGVGAGLALVLIVLGVTWALGGFSSEPEPEATSSCLWVPTAPTGAPDQADTGTPPSGELRSGFETMTVTTNLGAIEAVIDTSKAPCAAASLKYLGEKAFYNGGDCHRLNTDLKILTCGNPKGDGPGAASYQFADENLPGTPLPEEPLPTGTPPASPGASSSASSSASAPASAPAAPKYYAKGTIVMANTGANTNANQFSIVYGDGSTLPATYSIVGTVTKGLEYVEQVAQAGAVDAEGKAASDGKPKTTLTIQQLAVALPAVPSDAPSDQATPAGSAAP